MAHSSRRLCPLVALLWAPLLGCEAPPSALGPGADLSGVREAPIRLAASALTPRGTLVLAGVIEERRWPAFLKDDGEVVPFPGEGEWRDGLSLVAGPDGRLHAVWAADQERLYYARFDPDTLEGEAKVVAETGVGHGNLAVRADGYVAITYAEGWWSREPRVHPSLVRGSLEGGFTRPVRFHPEPPRQGWTPEHGAWAVGFASVVFDPQGDLEIVLAWDGPRELVVDHLRQAGADFTLTHRIGRTVYGPEPRLITRGTERLVAYVPAGDEEVVEVVRLLEEPGQVEVVARVDTQATIESLQATVTTDGAIRLGVAAKRGERTEVSTWIPGAAEPGELAGAANTTTEELVLNPGAGAMVPRPDAGLIYTWARFPEGYGAPGRAEVVTGSGWRR